MDDADGFGIGLVLFILVTIGFIAIIGLTLLIMGFFLKKKGLKIAGTIILGLTLILIIWAISPLFY